MAEQVNSGVPAPEGGEASVCADARAVIKLSPDQLTASVVFHAPENGGKDINWDILNGALETAGIKYGINKDDAQAYINLKKYEKTFTIAEGVPPVHGTDARFEYFFDLKKTGLPKIREDGTVDYRNIDRMTSVEERAKLMKLIPHSDGKAGISVLDTPIAQKKGKTRAIIPGKNTVLAPDGLTLLAAIAGEVREHNGKVSVSDLIEIKSDVGLETGNITFPGNIRISGGVSAGFRVVSTNGSVEVMGLAEGAYIEAENDIILNGGMKGGERGELVSRGNIVSKFIEGSKVTASGDITSEVVMNSDVTCLGKLDVSAGRGLIVGKTVRAGVEILGKVIGSRSGGQTGVEVGINPMTLEKYKNDKRELDRQQLMLEKMNKTMDYLVKLKIAGKLTVEQAASMSSVLQTIKSVKEKIFDLSEEIAELEPLTEDLGKGRVKISDTVYPGVKITIGRTAYPVEKEMKHCSFVRDGGEVRMAIY